LWDEQGKLSCVDSFNGRYPGIDEIIRKRTGCPMVGITFAVLFDRKAGDLYPVRFHVILVYSIIADHGVGHGHDLAVV
jgi:hypothetical protein